jgi:predicted O-methyltransferase YrrM
MTNNPLHVPGAAPAPEPAVPAPEPPTETAVRDLIARVYGASSGAAQDAFVAEGMAVSELVELAGLVHREKCQRVLEVGMANGTSSVVICEAMRAHGGGHLTSIDPYQSHADHFAGGGVRAVAAAGFASHHRLIEQASYLAMPALLALGATFDLVFIDGWHSFDFTFVDLFFADLLLKTGGILACHDTTQAPVFKAIRFFETNRPYVPVSPPAMVELPTRRARIARRLRTAIAGGEARDAARSRRERWRMLAAYRKVASTQMPENQLVDF